MSGFQTGGIVKGTNYKGIEELIAVPLSGEWIAKGWQIKEVARLSDSECEETGSLNDNTLYTVYDGKICIYDIGED